MYSDSFPRALRAFGGLVFSLALSGCFGTGDGPEQIAGTPAPPPPPSLCDPTSAQGDGSPFPLFFENMAGAYNFGQDAGFGGGATVVVENPVCTVDNVTPQVARMQKFAAEPFGGSSLELSQDVDFSQGTVFTMNVWSQRAVPVLFKFEDAISGDPARGIERVETHAGGSRWQTLCFDFTGATSGFVSNFLTLIFDNGTNGDAGNDPDNWTFYLDDIQQGTECANAPTTTLPVDFEDDPTTYSFGIDGGFAGGASDVIANPDRSGVNMTAQTARMRKFAGEVFGGSTLQLGGNVDFSQGSAFRMKVWSTRPVPVLFKFEDAISNDPNQGIERTETHPGGSTWVDLCFDFAGATGGFTSNSITFIFDGAIIGNADADPNNWTFYYDEIELDTSCTGAPAMALPQDFESGSANFGDFGGGVGDVITNPDQSGLNTSANTARMRKFAGETFGGATLSLPAAVDFSQGEAFTVKVWATRSVPVLFKLEDDNSTDPASGIEATLNHSGSGMWEELCFDLTGQSTGLTSSAITFIFDNGVAGNFDNAPNDWLFYFDEITQVASCPGAPATAFPQDFESGSASFGDFGGGVGDVIANPDQSGLNTTANTARMRKFAGELFGGTTLTLPSTVDFSQGEAFTMKVWATRAVPVLFKLEDDNNSDPNSGIENTQSHSGSGMWEEICFDLTGQSAGLVSSAITFIFDNGVNGDFDNTPNDWTFYFDEIEQVASCPGGGSGGGGTSGIGFESGSATFSDFGGGVGTVVMNPDASGINTSAQVGQMQKFAGDIFGGTTLQLPTGEPLAAGDSYLMKVRSQREVVVTFKLETDGTERLAIHSGSGTWEELCFDFTNVAVADVTGITLIFDNGIAGDAGNDPNNWTFQFDDIVQTSDACPAAPASTFEPITFDDSAITYTLADFGGNASAITNDPTGGTNQVVQVTRTDTAQDFAGTTVSTLANNEVPEPLSLGNVVMSVRVYSPLAGIPVRLKVEDSNDVNIFVQTDATTTVANAWETLTFDFGTPQDGSYNPINTYNRLSIFFNIGALGSTVGEQIYFFDDIVNVNGPGVTAPTAFPQTFESGSATFGDFGGGVGDVITNPDQSGLNTTANTARMRKFADQVFGGTTLTLPAAVDFSQGEVFTMKVWATRSVPVLFKLEDDNNSDPNSGIEATVSHSGSGMWEELCFDLTGQSTGLTSSGATFIFDNGVNGDAAGAPNDWTFYFDEITQVASCPGAGGGSGNQLAINGGFEAGDTSDWEVFPNGGSVTATTAEASEGTFSVNVIAAPGQNPVIKQERRAAGTVMPGDSITISFDMKGTLATDFGAVVIPSLFSEGTTVGTDDLDTITMATDTAFTTYSYTTTAGADVSGGVTLQIAVVCGGDAQCAANVFIDNVSFTLDTGT